MRKLALRVFQPFYGADSRLRYLFLRLYAWQEVPLLYLFFRISKLSLLRYAVIRKPFYYLLLHLLGTRGVVAEAATLAETEAFIDDLSPEYRIAVGPCRCRVGNHNCYHAIMTDIVIKQTASVWFRDLFPNDYRTITKEEAKGICRASRAAGLVQCLDRHMYFNRSENYFVICNCCAESCIPLIAYRLFKRERFHFLASRSVVSIDPDKCIGCGTCIDACPFEERELKEENGFATVLNCQGCGLCVDVCPQGANVMVPRV